MPLTITPSKNKRVTKEEEKTKQRKKSNHPPEDSSSDEEEEEDWETEEDEDEYDDEEEESEEETQPKKRTVRRRKQESDEEDEETTVVSSKKKKGKSKRREEEEEEEEEEEKGKKSKKKATNFLVFNIQEGEDEGEYLDDDEEALEDSDDDTADYGSDEEKVYMKERYEFVEEPPIVLTSKKLVNNKKKEDTKTQEVVKEEEAKVRQKVEQEYIELLETKKNLVKELKKKPNKIYEKALIECKQDIKRLIRRGRKDNVVKYHELVNTENNRMNEYKYFKKNLSHQEQTKIIEDYENVQKQNNFQKPYRIRVLESNISPQLKEIALHKIDQLREMMPGDPEYHKLKTWIDTFMKIPFGVYRSVDINIEKDGLEACNDYMTKAQHILDECVYGLDESKLQIMQMLGQWLTNPSAMGTAIAIKGSPGTGKTSLIKDGISKILGREFVFIALGGAGDGSYLEGHSYTYEGSMWGKIVQTLIDCKCMNPVIYFDELDKVSETPRGEEIIGILTHLTDTSQNMEFHDKYFSEIREFDLSKCLFIFSYNDETKINPILLNRMYVIQTKGYNAKEKTVIARKYLLPKISQQVKLPEDQIILSDEIMNHIITDERLTRKEDGVRNLKRCLEIIYTKLNLYRVMSSNNTFFQKYKDIPKDVTFPFTLTRRDLDTLIKNNENLSPTYLAMYN